MRIGSRNPLRLAGTAISIFLISNGAHAQMDNNIKLDEHGKGSLANLVDVAEPNIYSLTSLLYTISYIAGCCFAIIGLLLLLKFFKVKSTTVEVATEQSIRKSERKLLYKILLWLGTGLVFLLLPTFMNIVINSMGIEATQSVGVQPNPTSP